MRRAEGATLGRLLSTRLDEIAALTARAEKAPGRKPEAIKARLAEQVATLLSASERFDSDRLHQEAVLLAAKADIREELDRLASHVAQAKKLLADGGAIGRKLDFLAQELHRESNTLTAKANDVDLTNIGLELKSCGRAVSRAGAEPGVTMAKKRQEKTVIARRGLMLVLSSPSGAGKTTLSRRLLELDDNVTLSISVTTRKKRPSEMEGRDYYFIDRRRFDVACGAGRIARVGGGI